MIRVVSDTPFQIVVAEPYEKWAVDRLREVGNITELSAATENELCAAVLNADALLVRTYSQVTSKVVACAGKLKVIGRAGVGVENIDLVAASEKGIVVVNTPQASTEAVADLTLGMMLSLVRRIHEGDHATRSGQFLQARKAAREREMRELTLGIFGLGRIGKAVARRCRNGFAMKVIYNDVVDPGWVDFAAERVDFDELVGRSDVLSLHVPLTAATRGLFDVQVLSRMKKDALLINTCRGAVVDNMALANAIVAGPLAGAGLDVTDPEPLPMEHPLLVAPNTMITPHIGAKTVSAYRRMHEVVEDVIRVLQGGKPINPCQP